MSVCRHQYSGTVVGYQKAREKLRHAVDSARNTCAAEDALDVVMLDRREVPVTPVRVRIGAAFGCCRFSPVLPFNNAVV